MVGAENQNNSGHHHLLGIGKIISDLKELQIFHETFTVLYIDERRYIYNITVNSNIYYIYNTPATALILTEKFVQF